jgi:hypothetical protein
MLLVLLALLLLLPLALLVMGLLPTPAGCGATALLDAGCLACLLLADLRRPALACAEQANTSRQLSVTADNSCCHQACCHAKYA